MRLNNKLNYKKFGSFEIIKYIKYISFKLRLLLIIRIYPVFYIFLLEPAYLETPEDPILKINPEIKKVEYEIERILDVVEKRK